MKRLCIPVLIILLASCSQPGHPLSGKQKAQVTKEVETVLNDYYNDIRKDGLLAEFEYLDSTADFFWVPPGYDRSLGYDSIAAIIKQNASTVRSIDNKWLSLRIVPLSKDMACYTGKLESVTTNTSGVVNSMILMETGSVIKRPDGWKLLCGQTSATRQ
ncbi:nuclear transport factor 2 family protein [Polluticoccus soli]|uniref:nuclear transport factor 2 family protein n=1 Tax=Polluticoccus soli TaxID=3034150 RepID=UPI0023E333CA|nr:nuclear transport factor 2 family protein [Flavipsychrobacter sp. JY13-12]